MKSISFIPKSWKSLKVKHTRDTSIPSNSDLDPRSQILSASANSTSSTLVDSPKQRKRSVSLDRGQDPRRDNVTHFTPSTTYPKSVRPSTAPHGSSRRSHAQPIDKGFVRPRAPSDTSRTVAGLRPLDRVSTPEVAGSSSQTKPTQAPAPTSPRAPRLSPTISKFQSMDRYLSPSPAPTSGSHRVRVKKSMPELDGVWKGFLEDVNENADSIRLDFELVDDRQPYRVKPIHPPSRDSDTPRPRPPLETGLSTPASTSTSSTARMSPTRPRVGDRPELTSPKGPGHESHLPYQCSGTCCAIPPTEIRKGSLSPAPFPPSSGHEREMSADFPLSLFPIPPPLTQTMKNRVLPESSATVMLSPIQLVDASLPPKLKPPPRSPARRNVPQPLDIRSMAVAGPAPMPSPNLDSPPPSTPTTPRSPQSLPLHPLRTNSSITTLKKKPSGGPGGHPFAAPLPSPPTTPDHFGYISASSEPSDSYRTEKSFERPGLRPVYSSSQLRGYASPPPGAHRATMSETVHASGAARTPSRPLVVSTTHGPLQGNAYLYPRPAPDPSPHVQWGYAV